ncbi:MAG: ABC transporter ATP-binding protein [Bacteroidota bacterium]|nr:ABC transporter ATP-binding protein [Bacteroidota bacterium]
MITEEQVMERRMLLKVSDLEVAFRHEGDWVNVVDKIGFELYQSETLGIVGESGSGKSMTALSLMQLLPPSATVRNGRILFMGEGKAPVDLLSLGKEKMPLFRGKNIAMVFQEPMTSLNPTMTCGEQVSEAIILHEKVSKQEAYLRSIELFREVQLPRPEEMYRSYPHQLSGGQRQRVMIAMAISCRPSVLIADEPTTALDVTVQHSILELLKELQQKYKMSILFISHDLNVIAEIADRVMVVYHGKMVESGSIDEVLHHPQHAYTQALMQCRPGFNSHPFRLKTISDFLQEEGPSSPVIVNREILPHKVHYDVPPLLKLKEVNTRFVTKNNFWGRPKSYVQAVDQVSFEVYKGETLGLVGESGCGKTTLGRTILQLIENVSGSISYKGVDICKLPKTELRKLRKNIQIIFQDPYSSLNPKLTIGAAIIEPMQVHHILSNDRERKAKVLELLQKVGLDAACFNRYPHEFSGGQRQRIGIARALSLQPELVICDESVSALDVSVQAQVLNLLNDLKDEFQLTYIFISHDLSVVNYMSDRIAVMNHGKIEEIAPSGDLFKHPSTAYTQRLISSIPQVNK